MARERHFIVGWKSKRLGARRRGSLRCDDGDTLTHHAGRVPQAEHNQVTVAIHDLHVIVLKDGRKVFRSDTIKGPVLLVARERREALQQRRLCRVCTASAALVAHGHDLDAHCSDRSVAVYGDGKWGEAG